jgi:osmoprotectant transport system substrate-binding protein
MSWSPLAALAAGTYALKAVGPVALAGRTLPPGLVRGLDLVAVALLAALVAVAPLTEGRALALDARRRGRGRPRGRPARAVPRGGRRGCGGGRRPPDGGVIGQARRVSFSRTAPRHGAAALALAAAAALLAALAGCSGGDDGPPPGPGAGVRVTIADKAFTESAIVAGLYAEALRRAGFAVTVTSLPTTDMADQAVRDGDVDLHPEYTGTAFLTVLGRTARSAPGDDRRVYAQVRAAYADRGLVTLPPAPYDNDNAVACTAQAAERYSVRTLSDLGRASGRLVYSANAEHLTRDDGLPLLAREYGVDFRDVIVVDVGRRYVPVEAGRADCVYAFGTDPALDRLPLVVLRDDRAAFSAAVPFMNFAVVNARFHRRMPPAARAAFDAAIRDVHARLDARTVRALNARVEIDGDDPEDVARDLLAAPAA